MRYSSLTALAVATAWCGSLGAQTTALSVGRSVRVSAPAQRIYARTLTLFAATPDTLVLGYVVPGSWHSDTTLFRVAVSNVQRLEVRARRTDIVKDGVIGAGAGALAAFLIYRAGESSDCGWFTLCWKPGHAGQAALIGGSVGLAVGALVGALHSRQTWVSVPVSGLRGLYLGLAPLGSERLGAGIALAL